MPHRPIQKGFFLGLLLVVTAAFLWLVWDLVQPMFWAAVLAVLFGGVYRRIRRELRGRENAAAGISILVILVLVILPLTGIGVAVGREAAGIYERIQSGEIDLQAPLQRIEDAVPLASRFLSRFGIDTDRLRQGVSSAAATATQFLASQALAIGQNTLRLLLMIVVALYLLYFFLRDGERLVDGMVRALPLGDARERRLFRRFASITRATIKGTFIVGAIQGALGGITFAILGIRAAIFWGVIMTVISLLPAVGSVLVWGPAAIILMLTGSLVKGIVLLVIGIAIISTVDNVLRPILVGRETRMPDWVVFVSILGGIAAVGLSGFVIGPIVAGLFITVWEMFVEEYGHVDRADPGLPEPVARPPAVEPPSAVPARVDPPEAPPAGEGPAIEQPL